MVKLADTFKVLDLAAANKFGEDQPRMHATPYCIYLHIDYSEANAQAVVALCNQISAILKSKKIAPSNNSHLITGVDLRLSEYFTFRCTATSLDEPLLYIGAFDRNALNAAEFGKKCGYYEYFKKHMAQQAPLSVAKDTTPPANDSKHAGKPNPLIKSAPLSQQFKAPPVRAKFNDEDCIEPEVDKKKLQK